MRNLKKRTALIIFLCLVLVMAILPMQVFATDVTNEVLTSGDWKYILEDGNATITGYIGSDTTLNIPSTIESYTVTKIRETSLSGLKNVVEIVIPDTITEIGYDVFSGNTSLKTLTVPDSVTKIGGEFCNSCTSLETVKLPANLEAIEYHTFAGCVNLKEITIPSTVTSIGYYAFNNCKALKALTIPESVTTLDEGAFASCTGLTEVTIPAETTSIDASSFSNCTNTKFNVYYNSTAHAWTKTQGYSYELIDMPTTTITDTESKISIVLAAESTAEMKVDPIEESTDVYKELLEKLTNATPILAYDISVVNGQYDEKISITFTLGDGARNEYEGKEIVVLHKKASGEIEEFRQVVKDSKITIETTELSPFMLAVSNEVVETTDADELDDTPKTGTTDFVVLAMSIMLITGAAIVIMKKK